MCLKTSAIAQQQSVLLRSEICIAASQKVMQNSKIVKCIFARATSGIHIEIASIYSFVLSNEKPISNIVSPFFQAHPASLESFISRQRQTHTSTSVTTQTVGSLYLSDNKTTNIRVYICMFYNRVYVNYTCTSALFASRSLYKEVVTH